jgi:putative transposase
MRSRLGMGGYVYHVLNRAAGREPLFRDEADYAAFAALFLRAAQVRPMRLLAYCLMPDHWHLVLWPQRDGELSRYVGWLTMTHTQRHHARHRTAGTGAIYRGRFKSFPVQEGQPLWAVCRYAERSPVRAGLVAAVGDWRWSSLWQPSGERPPWLSDWPGGRPGLAEWREWANRPEPEADLAALRRCAERGSPYGDPAWVAATAERLGLSSTLRPRGRPRKVGGPKEPVRGVNLFSVDELVRKREKGDG